MAWAIQLDGLNNYFDVNISTSDDVIIVKSTLKLEVGAGVGDNKLIAFDPPGTAFIGFGIFYGRARIYARDRSGGAVSVQSSSIATGEYVDVEWRLDKNAGEVSVFVDGVEKTAINASISNFPATLTASQIFALNGSENVEGDYQNFTIVDSTTSLPTLNLDATASDHSNTGLQPVLVDTIGSNNATGVNFPTDGSAWIDLGGGGGSTNNSELDFSVAKPEFSSSVEVNKPEYTSTINLSIQKPLFSAIVEIEDPIFASALDFNVSKPEFSSSATTEKPEYNLSVAFDITKPIFNASVVNGAKVFSSLVSVLMPEPEFSATSQSIKPEYNSGSNITISKPIFSATVLVLEPSNNTVVNLTVNKPEFSSSVATTKPNYDSEVDFALSSPVFSAMVVNGVISFSFSERRNFNTKSNSTNIDIKYNARNLEL